ncbi:MAG: hypothetical protein ABIH29_01400 [Candidatus Micrarchaeota archaeon]
MFGDTTLVDDNGAPLAKVVLGSKSAAPDGVAAGLIAGKMVSESYAVEELTAQVAGTATCGEGSGTGTGTGTCDIADEKAKLQITVPGSAMEGTYTVNNLIGDYLNRRLKDREDNVAGDSDSDYPMGGSDVSENANPFTDGTGPGGSIGPSETFLYRIDGGMFSPFQTQNLVDDDAARNYVEEQNMWLQGDSHYDESPEEIVGDLRFLAYTLKFSGSGDDFGIPVCTTPDGTDYADCLLGATPQSHYETASHKVRVYFLGEQWVISDMSPPLTALTSETSLVDGGWVKLAKESISGVINQGEALPVDDLKFQLDDLEAHGDTTAAIISVLDANGNVLKKDKVGEGDTKEFAIEGTTYRFHVYKVAPGYTFGAKWADVAIYSKELKLEDGQQLDPDYDNNEYYEVALGWKNKGAQAGVDEQPDFLRTAVVFTEDIGSISSGGEEQFEVGDYLPIVQDPVAWRLTYQGLDITNSERTYLRYDLERTTDKTLTASHGPVTETATGIRVQCDITAPYVEVKSGGTGTIFEMTGSTGEGDQDTTLAATRFYVATNGATCENDTSVVGGGFPAGCPLGVCPAGTIFMTLSPSSNDYGLEGYDEVADGGAACPNVFLSQVVDYSTIGDGDTDWLTGGMLEVSSYLSASPAAQGFAATDNGCSYMGGLRAENTTPCMSDGGTDPRCFGDARLVDAAANTDWYFGLSEKAGVDSSNDFADYHLVGLDLDGGDSTFNFDSQTAGGDYITREDYELYMFAGPVSNRGNIQTQEEGFISERGSVFDDISDTSVRYYMADDLAYSQWYLSSVEQSEAEAGSVVRTLGEGEETTVNGVTVKVLEITETVLPCSVGTAATPACGPADMSGVSAVIMPQNTATVTASIPYAYSSYGNLVVLDKDAVGVNTLVSVGGDKVNTVTKELLSGSAVDWTTTKKVVREVVQGSKIVVAGAESEDTLAAAQDFVNQLRRV